MVEQTAHNGLDVGSNPTKLIFYIKKKMKIKTKNHKLEKIKYYYKTKKLLFLFDSYNSNTKEWLNIEQKIKKSNFKYYKILNTITKNFLKKTIFTNFEPTILGSLKLTFLKNNKGTINLPQIKKKVFTNFKLYKIKLNNKFYSQNQIKNMKVLNYKTNMYSFNQNLKSFLKLTTLKFRNNVT